MDLQLLEALQEFVTEVNWHVNKTSEMGFENLTLDEKSTTLDSVLHARIVAEKARMKALSEN